MNEAKSQLTQSWLTKAQHDLASADVLSQSQLPLLDTAIYHCQQAAEKSVKGFLVFRYPGIATQPTEDQFDQAYEAAMALYDFVLSVLPIGVHPAPFHEESECGADLARSESAASDLS